MAKVRFALSRNAQRWGLAPFLVAAVGAGCTRTAGQTSPQLTEILPSNQLIQSADAPDASLRFVGANFVPKVELQAAGESLKANATFALALSADGGEVMRLVGPADGVVYKSTSEITWALDVRFPAGVDLPIGTYAVAVIDPSGRQTDSLPLVVSDASVAPISNQDASALLPAPSISSIEPRCGSYAGGETVTIRGANFLETPTVSVGEIVVVGVTVDDASILRATIPGIDAGPGGTGEPREVDVKVETSGGSATFSGAYTYITGTVVSVFPSIGVDDGGAQVTVTGTSFMADSGVTFGGREAVVVGGVADGGTQITVITPPSPVAIGDAGSVAVAVTATGRCGAATLDAGYRYVSVSGAPVVSSISPITGPEIGGTLVEIFGQNFDPFGETLAYIGPYPLTNIVVIDPGLLRGLTPSGSASDGPRAVTVITQKGAGQLAAAFTYDGRPAIEAVFPDGGPVAGGIPVTIRGQGFIAGTGFSIGSTPVPGVVITVVDAGIYEARGIVPPGTAPGTVNVVAYNQNGLATMFGGFVYYAQVGLVPTVGSIAPFSGPLSGGTLVDVFGANFTSSTVVQIGGVNLADAGFVDANTISGFTPAAGASGQVSVTAYTPNIGGTWDSGVRFTYNTAVLIASVLPAMGPTSGGTTVVIDGDGFIQGATRVYFGGVEATGVIYEMPNPTQKLSVESPPAVGPGLVNVTVVDDFGQAIAANAFTYFSAPTITSLYPDGGNPSGGTLVEISGTDLVDVTSVKFDGLQAVSFWDAGAASGKVMAISPALNDAGSVPVTVMALGGTSNAATFTYSGTAASGPTVERVDPATGLSAGGTSVRVFGSNFDAGMVVLFDGVALLYPSFVNSNEIDGVTPAHAPGLVAVSVGGGRPLANAFRFLDPPTISTIVPANGSEQGGTSVTITGTNLAQGATVMVGTQALINVVVTGTTTLTGVTQTHAAGTVDVTVTTASGAATKTSGYTYDVSSLPPQITNISPAVGAEDGGTWVVVTGSGFDAGTEIRFGSAPMAISGPILPNQVTGFAPRGAGAVTVQVDWPSGGTWSPFTYVSPPHVASIAPTYGPASGGTPVAIYGTGFADAGGATIGGTPLGAFSVVDSTTITGVTAAMPEGPQNVVVANAQFGASPETVTFTVTPNFTVSGISPKLWSEDGGREVTITGSSFTDAGFIAGWGATALVNSTTIRITIPAGQGTKIVSVTIGETKTCPDASDCTFTYMPGPTLSGMTPVLGPTAGGTSVELAGANLASVTGVTFGGNPAGSVAYDAVSGKVVATSTAGVAGNAVVELTTLYGWATAPATFRYVAPPTVTSVVNTGVLPNINEGQTSISVPVTISGTNFVDASVEFDGGGVLSNIVVVNETTITANTPVPVAAGYVMATVRATGGAGSLAKAFYYVVAPTVSGVSPDAGPYAGGTPVSISGSGFSPATVVRFGGVADAGLLSAVFVSTTLITGTTPAVIDAGLAPIMATNVAGSGVFGPGFEYDTSSDLAITSVAPGIGTVEGNVPVTIFGRNFTGVSGVLFDGGAVQSFLVVDSNTINVTTAASAFTGRVNVDVCKPGCAGAENHATLAGGFEYIPAVALGSIYPPVGPTVSAKVTPTLQHVTIQGANFRADAGLVVTIGGLALINQVRVNDTTIMGEVPNGAADYAKVDVTISSAVTGTKTLDAGYSYWPAKSNFKQGDLNGDVFAFAEHTPTRMWVATGKNGLVQIGPEDGGVIRSYKDQTGSNKTRDVAVWTSGANHRLVIASDDNGLEVCSVDAGTTEIVAGSCAQYFTSRVSRGLSVLPDGRAYSATNFGFRGIDLNTGVIGCWRVSGFGCGRHNTNGIAVDTVRNAVWLATECGVWGTTSIPAITGCADEGSPTVVSATQVNNTSGSVQAVRIDPSSSYLYAAMNSNFGGMGRCTRTATPDCQGFSTISSASPPFPSNCRQAQDVALGTLGFAWVGTSCNNLSAGFGRFNMMSSPMAFDSEWVSAWPDPTKQLRVNGVYVDSREVKWVGGAAGRNAGVIRYTEW